MLAEPNKPVYIVEGEKDADRLAKDGLVATTNAGGAGKFRDELKQWFKDRDVVILPDNDEAGHKHAADIARRLRNVARRIRVVVLPEIFPKKGTSPTGWTRARRFATCGASS
jgi:DNA primase